jgi:ribosomal protein S18 acetylase RimI-like enzyme
MISIVEYEPKFKSHFESLNRSWIEKYFYLEPRDEYVLKNPEEAILQKGGTILFALYNEVVVGVVALIKIDSEIYEFAKMGVDENFRRKGIAEALSRAAFKKLKSLKATKLILFSNTLLEPAIRLYRKLGFTEVTLDQFTDYRRSNIKMELLLDQAP